MAHDDDATDDVRSPLVQAVRAQIDIMQHPAPSEGTNARLDASLAQSCRLLAQWADALFMHPWTEDFQQHLDELAADFEEAERSLEGPCARQLGAME